MQDITEQQELAQEISDAISKPVGFGEEFDEVGDAFKIQIDFYISEVSLWDFLNAVCDSERIPVLKQMAVHLLVPDLFKI